MSDKSDLVTNLRPATGQTQRTFIEDPELPPIPNYTLATVCPRCEAPVVRRACKVRCERCGFMWDCSEL